MEASLQEEVYIPISRWHKQYQIIKVRCLHASLLTFSRASWDTSGMSCTDYEQMSCTDYEQRCICALAKRRMRQA